MRIAPSNFYADPLGYAGNQSGHIMLGVAATYWFAWGWRVVDGELPLAWLCVAVWAITYLAIEFSQGESGVMDRLEDIATSIGYPAVIAIWARDAFAAAPFLFDALLPIFGLYTAQMAVGGGIRLWQAYKEGKNL